MYCTKCGHQNKDDAAFCIQCGTALKSAETVLPAAQEPAKTEPGAPEAPSIYNAPPTDYQAAPPAYQPYAGYVPPKKKRTGLIIGLSVGGVVLVAAVVTIVLMLTGGQSAQGIWCNEKHAEVIEFDDDDDVTIYKVGYEIDGSYEFDVRSGEGLILTDDREYDFEVRDNQLIIDDQRGYIKMSDDFDIDEFIEDASPEQTEKPEPTDATASAPPPTAVPTVVPTAPPTQMPSDTTFNVPGTDATVATPEGWYVYDDSYDESYVMCLTDGDNRYVDFYRWTQSAADLTADLEEMYGDEIVGAIETTTIGGFPAYRFQYVTSASSVYQGYEIVVDLPNGTLEIDAYVTLPETYTEIWDASNSELQLLRSIADSLTLGV